ncbi:Putative ABC transport system substrate-binding protein [Melioribacter roseus P3M-2]|uniref:Putative ABC transport system substrate-binding protein n=1 Tax=Melioribacter roseus (strain DSM 23840 / JCM 17771 / VKM B-2668 / P3M-2) TaxID=1191523 RepID=I6ZXI2_MELRP|nr:MlaD family protein [Melioribacter roseus]AFN73768.1 Putative ABC transport system substrate-binding protein [Melioribacter roseus P3M-2]
MLKQLEGARLGLFIFIGTVLLIISIFLIGSRENLFTSAIEIKTYFDQIEGLKPGAPVRLSGYDVGSVSSISLVGDEEGNVEVVMRIDNDLVHFIRLDSEASIETEGLVGKKIITITPGSADQPVIKNGGIIKSKNPLNLSVIMEQTESTISYLKDLTRDLAEIIAKVNRGEGTIGKIVNDDRLYESAVSITQNADRSLTQVTKRLTDVSDIIVEMTGGIKSIISNVDSAIYDVKRVVDKVDRGEGVLGVLVSDQKMADSLKQVISNLTRTSDEARMATSSLYENMEALKHNWLFKGYFEERGYWNKVEYERDIEKRIEELKKQNQLLDMRIKELLELEKKLDVKE